MEKQPILFLLLPCLRETVQNEDLVLVRNDVSNWADLGLGKRFVDGIPKGKVKKMPPDPLGFFLGFYCKIERYIWDLEVS